MQLLRDCERLASEEYQLSAVNEPIPVTLQFVDHAVSSNGNPIEMEFVHTDSPEELATKLAEGLSQLRIETNKDSCLQAICQEGNPYQRIIESLYYDLAVCHEIFVNLENMMASARLSGVVLTVSIYHFFLHNVYT